MFRVVKDALEPVVDYKTISDIEMVNFECVKLRQRGLYMIRWHNAYSMINSKEVSVSLNIIGEN